MAEPAVAVITVGACAATGAFVHPVLCAAGVDPITIGASVAGCTIAQIFLPGERVSIPRIASVAFGSVLFASVGTPFAALAAVKFIPTGATPIQTQVLIAAIMGGLAKPIVLFGYKKWLRWQAKQDAKDAKDAKDVKNAG